MPVRERMEGLNFSVEGFGFRMEGFSVWKWGPKECSVRVPAKKCLCKRRDLERGRQGKRALGRTGRESMGAFYLVG